MYIVLSSIIQNSLYLSAKIVTQYILSADYLKFGDLIACEPYIMLLLILSLVLIIPKTPSEIFKLSSPNQSSLWSSDICTITEISFKGYKKEQKKTFRSQQDTPFLLRALYHKIIRQNWAYTHIPNLRNTSQIWSVPAPTS